MLGRETFYVMGIDPSGSFKEGQGTTGWCIIKVTDKITLITTGEVCATHYRTAEEYWEAHLHLIEDQVDWRSDYPLYVSMEAYVLYANKAKAQINSEMETSQLIGAIRVYCRQNDIVLAMRNAGAVKDRWADHILEHKGIPVKGMSNHVKDAIRHAVHYATFRK